MIKIDVVSECTFWRKKIKKNNAFFNSIVKFFPKKYKFIGKKINLTILLSNNKNIKKLNKDFRNKNKPTDVLSFPFEKKFNPCLLYTSPSPRDGLLSRMPSSA